MGKITQTLIRLLKELGLYKSVLKSENRDLYI